MGTNYYIHRHSKTCECCQRCDEDDIIHIGKSSIGCTFSFSGIVFKSYRAIIDMLDDPDTYILDELGATIPKDEFFALVENKRDSVNHTEDTKIWYEVWLDDEGNSFYGREFS